MINQHSEVLISVNPTNELVFLPESVGVQSSFVIYNHSQDAVLFKVKTTSPAVYSVSPAVGEIRTGDSVCVQVAGSGAVQSSHKFQVLAVARPIVTHWILGWLLRKGKASCWVPKCYLPLSSSVCVHLPPLAPQCFTLSARSQLKASDRRRS